MRAGASSLRKRVLVGIQSERKPNSGHPLFAGARCQKREPRRVHHIVAARLISQQAEYNSACLLYSLRLLFRANTKLKRETKVRISALRAKRKLTLASRNFSCGTASSSFAYIFQRVLAELRTPPPPCHAEQRADTVERNKSVSARCRGISSQLRQTNGRNRP